MSIDIEEYYERYGPMVLRRCRSLLKDEDLALDAMQDTFVKLMRYQNKLTDDAPSSLLYTMATNICLNKLRSAGSRLEDPTEDDLLGRIALADEPYSGVIAKRVLDKLFSGEKASTQTIAVMHLLDGMTLEEVADHVGLSVSGVRLRLRRLRKHLRELEGAAI